MSKKPTTVRIELGQASYDVVIGNQLMQDVGVWVTPRLNRKHTAIIMDTHVAELYGDELTATFNKHDISHQTIILQPGEQTKSFEQLQRLLNHLLEAKIERHDTIIAFGGGVIGDISGFAASVLRRGVGIIHLPTTLLAQVDSAIGGKTGINTPHGKNLVGTFHQPKLVLADTDFLDTLGSRNLRAGYAEVVKYGALGNRSFFNWLENHGTEILSGNKAYLTEAVIESVRAKAQIIEQDIFESGSRQLLNLGHTFAHALETESGHNETLLHGEAVALGIVLAFDLSVRLGYCPSSELARVKSHFASVGLPTRIREVLRPSWSVKALISHMQQDKKIVDGKLSFVLVRSIGDAFLCADVKSEILNSVLTDSFAENGLETARQISNV